MNGDRAPGNREQMNREPESEKEREERKRDRAYDPVQRWKHIQETITWAEANMAPHLRRNRPRWPGSQPQLPNSSKES